mgnify:CR=1 FL=1
MNLNYDKLQSMATDAGIIKQDNFSPDELSNILASIYFPGQKRRVMIRRIKSVLMSRPMRAVV